MRHIHHPLVIALGLSITSLALARQPPALVEQQRAADSATQSSAGYRDITWRFGVVASRTPQVLRASGGYRDIHHRFRGGSVLPAHASAAPASRWR
jgi:hypothetical protein